ncbi:ROK family transcriptional regulator [Neobacillus sp. SM06]|uniref:ROK family transcriptional regulator n=1 Tax=Neobacillus sp. SM06 TaxID=3422492 RepID=UPI003D26DADF
MADTLLTGSFQLMKSMNRSVILNSIREKGPISRAEIAKQTGLTPPTVSNLVKELLQAEMVMEQRLGESSGGRKPTLLTLNSERFHVIGLDVGSHDIKIILTTITGKVLKKATEPIPPDITNEKLLSFIIESIHSLTSTDEIDETKIIGIGVGMHGIVDVEKGVSILAPNLKLKNIPIKEVLEKEFNWIVKVENDARVMGLGELWFGHGAGVNSFVCINVGRGIGAGIVMNGKLYHGNDCISGEIGHMTIDLNGPKCTCGNDGCLQTFASGPSIAEKVKKELRSGHASLLEELVGHDDGKITGEMVYKAALQGDPLAISALTEAGRYLGIGITNLIHAINPKRIILGGGVLNAKDFILTTIANTVQQRALTDAAKQTEIVVSKLGEDATAMGAVALILVEIFASKGVE